MLVDLLLLLVVEASGMNARENSMRGDQCRIGGRHAALEVSVPRSIAGPEKIWIEGSVEAVLIADYGTAAVHITSPLVMKTHVPRAQLAFRLRKPTEIFGGRVRIGRGFQLEAQFVANRQVGVRVPDAFFSQFPLANNKAGLNPTFVVNCRALEVSSPLLVEATPISTLGTRFGAFVSGSGDELALFRSANEAELPIALWSEVRLERIDVRRGWTKVRARWTDGTQILGWTRSALVPANDDFWSGDGTGGCGNSEMEGGFEAIAIKGAGIYSNDMDSPWARFAAATRVEVISSVTDWYLVYHIEGVFRFGCGGRFEHFPIGRVRATELRKLRRFPYPVHIPRAMQESL